MRLKRIDYLMAMLVALTVAAVACGQVRTEDGALCGTDSECAALCPPGTRDLPADHPDYCDGGPQSAPEYRIQYSPTLGRSVPVEACQRGAS